MEMSDKGHISELVQDDKNFNKHSEYGMGLLEKSVSKFGMGRSILVDKNNKIIAGNGITETAGNVGIEKVKFVDTDGTEIIAVRRKDIDLDTPEGREMALADNATGSANLKWEKEKILQEVGEIVAKEWGVKIAETQIMSDLEYNSMYYEPQNKPTIHLEDCVEKTRFYEKMKIVEESSLPDEKKEMLKWFVYRFLRIDFQAVADYYAFNASDEEKKVIERLRLVLVDGGVDGFIEDRLLRVVRKIQDVVLAEKVNPESNQ